MVGKKRQSLQGDKASKKKKKYYLVSEAIFPKFRSRFL